jgi:hypothetical protein
VRKAWEDFWFRPTPTSTIAVLRIAYGTVVLAWCASVVPDLLTFFSPSGWLSEQNTGWGVFRMLNSSGAVIVVFVVFVVATLALIVGYRTRIASVVVFVVLSSLLQRNPYLETGGETLLRLLGFFLMFAPAGESLSLDRLRRVRDRFWEFPKRAPWAQRLIQVQMSLMYLFTVFIKVSGRTWGAGTAVGYALRVAHYTRVPVPGALIDSLVIVNLLTWSTLLIELSLAILVWNRRLRPWVLAAGIALHLAIELTIKVGFFSWAVFVTYIAFVPEGTMAAWILRARAAVLSRRRLWTSSR